MSRYLISQLIDQKILKTRIIIEAFKKIDRSDFVPENVKEKMSGDQINNFNSPLETGFGQTISQPQTVAFMLELLQPQKGEKILDIGSGSGWQSALLAHLVGDKGKIYAIELIEQLKEFGQQNAAKYKYQNIEFILADGSKGLPKKAPFDKIIAAAAAHQIPNSWKEQIKEGGRIVCPILNSIWLFIKNKDGSFEEKEFPGYVFVPLI